ncbi:MAG: AEC family transporter, partial [Paracoccaceae bacterium]
MASLLDVILPVFLVIGFGYAAVWKGLFSESATDGLMKFAVGFGVPCLLFLAVSEIDISKDFNVALLASFYIGAFAGFGLGFLGAKYLFKRSVEDSISIGFCSLFSNTVLLGLPIIGRAYGSDSLTSAYAIIAVHALLIYGFGITVMELALARKSGSRAGIARKITRTMISNPI